MPRQLAAAEAQPGVVHRHSPEVQLTTARELVACRGQVRRQQRTLRERHALAYPVEVFVEHEMPPIEPPDQPDVVDDHEVERKGESPCSIDKRAGMQRPPATAARDAGTPVNEAVLVQLEHRAPV